MLASGVLLLLETLTSTERAAYIFREAFEYSYREIANALRLEEANARQLATRARQRVAGGRRMSVSSIEQRRLLDAFIAAAENGDVTPVTTHLRIRSMVGRSGPLRIPHNPPPRLEERL